MRTSRIIEMIYLLLDNRMQTANDLAKHFNVSTKTIYRDVETLIKAGIPIYMQQGVNGGITLSKDFLLNRNRLTKSEERNLMDAIENIKKLPNAQLEFALKVLKQFFNEASTLWINTDDVSIDIQDKFHIVKNATIEKRVIEFEYFDGKDFIKYKVESYELRIKEDIWKVVVRNINTDSFEELFLSRMKNIYVTTKYFTRREMPDNFSKAFKGDIIVNRIEVNELTDELLNKYPIENFDNTNGKIAISIRLKVDKEIR